MKLVKLLTDNLICSRERIISSLQGCRSSDRVIACDCSVACPSLKKAALPGNRGFPFLWTVNHGNIHGCGP